MHSGKESDHLIDSSDTATQAPLEAEVMEVDSDVPSPVRGAIVAVAVAAGASPARPRFDDMQPLQLVAVATAQASEVVSLKKELRMLKQKIRRKEANNFE